MRSVMQVQAPSPTVLVRFGVFELDLRTGELRKAGARLRLPNQAFIVLAELLERPNELVTRDEFRARLWPTDTFVDFEHGLNAAVRRVREVLGDSAVTPRFIETLPRRGYRFVASVQRVPARCDELTTDAPPLRSRSAGALLEWVRKLCRSWLLLPAQRVPQRLL
jgi:DNA-binding winged helix-turn-helix (wHTH) protein